MFMVLDGATTTGATAGQALNNALTTNVTGTSIMSDFISVLPWVAGIIGVSFLLYEGRKLLKGTAKGKLRV